MGSHDHGTGTRKEEISRMRTVLAVTGGFMFVEACAGFYTGSLALLADAGHMLGDVAALVLALVAFHFSARPATAGKTFGYYRTEILAGLTNAIAMIAMSFFILFEAYQRLKSPPEVTSLPMLVVALLGLCINVVCVLLLRKSAEESLNVKAAYLEVLGDLLASVGVLVAAIVMLTTRWYLADPLISGVIGLLILPRTWHVLSECINILMEGAPGHIDLSKLRLSMCEVGGVVDVHDIHVWTLTSGMDAMSCHVTIDKDSPADVVLGEITRIVQDDYGLRHTTVQVEQVECKGKANGTCST